MAPVMSPGTRHTQKQTSRKFISTFLGKVILENIGSQLDGVREVVNASPCCMEMWEVTNREYAEEGLPIVSGWVKSEFKFRLKANPLVDPSPDPLLLNIHCPAIRALMCADLFILLKCNVKILRPYQVYPENMDQHLT